MGRGCNEKGQWSERGSGTHVIDKHWRLEACEVVPMDRRERVREREGGREKESKTC